MEKIRQVDNNKLQFNRTNLTSISKSLQLAIAVVQKNGCFFVMSEIPQKAVVGPEEGYEPLGE